MEHSGEGQGLGREETVGFNKNLLFEVFRRADAVTVARASCASRDFYSVAEDEALWERLCNERWPSTVDARVKAIVLSAGGYRKLYANCYHPIVNRPSHRSDHPQETNDGSMDYQENSSDLSDFVSIVDVIYEGRKLFSVTIEGIPGFNCDLSEWLLSCPFRIDLLRPMGKDDKIRTPVLIETDLSFASIDMERKQGKCWKILRDNLRVSWILINKKSKRMANLASWQSLGGLRHWPCDEDFQLRFGSILPPNRFSTTKSMDTAIQCNIVTKCRLIFERVDGQIVKTSLGLAELSLQLEDSAGVLASGKDAVGIFHRALSCPKSRSYGDALNSYQKYAEVVRQLKKKEIRDDTCLNTSAALVGICSCACFFISWLFFTN